MIISESVQNSIIITASWKKKGDYIRTDCSYEAKV